MFISDLYIQCFHTNNIDSSIQISNEWFSQELTNSQEERQLEVYLFLLYRYKTKSCLNRIVPFDKNWIVKTIESTNSSDYMMINHEELIETCIELFIVV